MLIEVFDTDSPPGEAWLKHLFCALKSFLFIYLFIYLLIYLFIYLFNYLFIFVFEVFVTDSPAGIRKVNVHYYIRLFS